MHFQRENISLDTLHPKRCRELQYDFIDSVFNVYTLCFLCIYSVYSAQIHGVYGKNTNAYTLQDRIDFYDNCFCAYSAFYSVHILPRALLWAISLMALQAAVLRTTMIKKIVIELVIQLSQATLASVRRERCE